MTRASRNNLLIAIASLLLSLSLIFYVLHFADGHVRNLEQIEFKNEVERTLSLIVERMRFYGTEFGLLLMVITGVITIGALLLWSGGLLNAIDRRRKDALDRAQKSQTELEVKNRILENANSVMVDREVLLEQMKTKINELLAELGRPAAYDISREIQFEDKTSDAPFVGSPPPHLKLSMIAALVVLFLVLVGTMLAASSAWTKSNNMWRSVGHKYRLTELRGIILNLDEVLTMSAWMAGSTGDPKWETRYRKYEGQLDQAIKEVAVKAPALLRGKGALQTDLANQRLVRMENKVFRLVREGRLKEASLVLDRRAYKTQKKIYAGGMTALSESLALWVSEELVRSRRAYGVHLAVSLASVAVLIFFMAVVFLMFLRMKNNMHKSDVRQLGDMNKRLDLAVAERTRELESARLAALNILEDMKTANKRYQDLVEGAPDPIITLSPLGILESVNPAGEEAIQFRKDELVGKHFSGLGILEPTSLITAMKVFALILFGKKQEPFNLTFIRRDGEKIYFEANARVIKKRKIDGVQVILRDVTARKKLQAKLAQAQKMEMLGTLTAGIAHDLNNLLMPVLGYVDLVLQEGKVDQDTALMLSQAKSSAERCAVVVRRFRDIGKPTLGGGDDHSSG